MKSPFFGIELKKGISRWLMVSLLVSILLGFFSCGEEENPTNPGSDNEPITNMGKNNEGTAEEETVIPDSPQKVKVVTVGDEEVIISWGKPADGVKEIRVYRSDGEGKTLKRIAKVPKEKTEYTDNTAPNGVEVTYQLTACTDENESEKSDPVKATASADEKLQERLKEAEKAYKNEDIALMESICEADFWRSNRFDFEDAFANVDHEIWSPEVQEIRYKGKTAIMSGKLSRSLSWADMEIQTSHQEALRQFTLLKSNDGIWRFTALDEDFPRKALKGGPMATTSTANASNIDMPIQPNSLVFLLIWTQDAKAFTNTSDASATGPDGKKIKLVFIDGSFAGVFLAPNKIGDYRITVKATSKGQEIYSFEHVVSVKKEGKPLAAPQEPNLSKRDAMLYLTKQIHQRVSYTLGR